MQKSRASQMVLLAWNFFRVLGRCCDGKGLQDFAAILFPCFLCAVPDSDVGPTPRPMVPPCCFLPRDLRHTATRLYLSIGLQPPAGPKTAANPATPATSKMAPAPSSGIRFCSGVLPVCFIRNILFFSFSDLLDIQFTTHSRSICGTMFQSPWTPTVFFPSTSSTSTQPTQPNQPWPLGAPTWNPGVDTGHGDVACVMFAAFKDRDTIVTIGSPNLRRGANPASPPKSAAQELRDAVLAADRGLDQTCSADKSGQKAEPTSRSTTITANRSCASSRAQEDDCASSPFRMLTASDAPSGSGRRRFDLLSDILFRIESIVGDSTPTPNRSQPVAPASAARRPKSMNKLIPGLTNGYVSHESPRKAEIRDDPSPAANRHSRGSPAPKHGERPPLSEPGQRPNSGVLSNRYSGRSSPAPAVLEFSTPTTQSQPGGGKNYTKSFENLGLDATQQAAIGETINAAVDAVKAQTKNELENLMLEMNEMLQVAEDEVAAEHKRVEELEEKAHHSLALQWVRLAQGINRFEAEVFWCGMWAREKRKIADACRVAAPGTQSQETGLEPSVSQGLSGRTEAFV